MATTELQEEINAIKARRLPLHELRLHLSHASPIIRANAVEAVAEFIHESGPLLQEVVDFAKNPDHSFRLMGTISIAHIAVLSLLRSHCVEARRSGAELLESWPESDRQDLLWFLESEGANPVVPPL